jgi:hypothetical protein
MSATTKLAAVIHSNQANARAISLHKDSSVLFIGQIMGQTRQSTLLPNECQFQRSSDR